MRFRNAKDLYEARYDLVYSSVLVSSSCLITIVETNSDFWALAVIYVVKYFRVERKHLVLIVPTFNENTFKNLTLNYDVTIENRDKGKLNIQIIITYPVIHNDLKNIFLQQMVVSYTLYALHWVRGMYRYSMVPAHGTYNPLWERRLTFHLFMRHPIPCIPRLEEVTF